MEVLNKSDKYLIILSTSYWDSPLKFRRHQWALIGSKNGYKVIYVNPTFTIASFIQDRDARHIFWHFFTNPVQIVNPNLMILTMPPLFPFQRRFLWIDKLNRKISGWLLNQRLKKLRQSNNVTILAYEPTDIYRPIHLSNAMLVYECVDEHSEYPFNKKVKDKIIAIEKRLLQKVDVVSVTSLFLLEKKKALNMNHVYVPNGVNFHLFQSALKPETCVASDISDIPGPIILYVGAIMEWFDYDLVLSIAENRNWNIVLIGPQTVNTRLFKGRSNIHCLGVKRQSELPNYLKKADVCIIPFLINDLVKGVNPLKLYEYLASGRPVVSTALPDVIPFSKPGFVHIGYDHAEFVKHLDFLITAKEDQNLTEARMNVARDYSWERIYESLMSKVEEVRAKKT